MAYARPKFARVTDERDVRKGTMSRQLPPINKAGEIVAISQLRKGTEMLPPLAELCMGQL